MDERQIKLLYKNSKIKLTESPRISLEMLEITKQGITELDFTLTGREEIVGQFIITKISGHKDFKFWTRLNDKGFYYGEGQISDASFICICEWETYIALINEELNEEEMLKARNAGKFVITGNLEDLIEFGEFIGYITLIISVIYLFGLIGLFFKSNICRYIVIAISSYFLILAFPFAIALFLCEKDVKALFRKES